MIDSKRLTILKAITTLLKTVTKVNGYQFDLSNSVWRGITVFGEGHPVPCVSLLESLNPDRDMQQAGVDNGRKQTDKWVLLIQGWVDDDSDNPTDPAHALMADVKKALAQVWDSSSEYYRLGNNLIATAAMEPGTVRPPDDNSSKAYFYLRFIVTVSETPSDPYDLT